MPYHGDGRWSMDAGDSKYGPGVGWDSRGIHLQAQGIMTPRQLPIQIRSTPRTCEMTCQFMEAQGRILLKRES
jgi:hypothetical protein